MGFVERKREFAPSYWFIKEPGNVVQGRIKKTFDTQNGEAVAIETDGVLTKAREGRADGAEVEVGDGAEVCLIPPAAVKHILDMEPGTYVRITCGEKNVKTKRGTAWAMTLEEDPDKFQAPDEPDWDDEAIS